MIFFFKDKVTDTLKDNLFIAFFGERDCCLVVLPLGLEGKFSVYLSTDRFDFLTCFVEETAKQEVNSWLVVPPTSLERAILVELFPRVTFFWCLVDCPKSVSFAI